MKKYIVALITAFVLMGCTNTDAVRVENDLTNGHSQGKYSKDGKRDGEWYGIYNDGIVAYVGFYNNGVLHGEYNAYYNDGKIKERGRYSENGKKIGEWIEYYNNGGISKLTHYSENGDKDIILYRNDGKVLETRKESDDKISGLTYKYDENGNFIGREHFGVE
ncbi:toxin-antitoxin system YwqK family antitoxin [Cetobacterium sp. SF1]|uniref:toxin-antitoxin system YwqK family antitoxin n=1 Tax=unclassified Cetobacterium TaxID=2630983 RepID=UPI003CEB0AD1